MSELLRKLGEGSFQLRRLETAVRRVLVGGDDALTHPEGEVAHAVWIPPKIFENFISEKWKFGAAATWPLRYFANLETRILGR